MTANRLPSGSGKATIVLDLRARNVGNTDPTSAYWNKLDAVVGVLNLLAALVGPDAECFFDFGRITISELDLEELEKRISP